VSLCQSFPTLFDLVDESTTMEVDGVAKADYMQVVDECYLCDLCYQTKCPYVPPHEWNVDYPHLMLRAKAIKFKKGNKPVSKRIISNSGNVGKLASLPVINTVVNAGNESPTIRKVLEKTLKIHRDADLPRYHGKTLRNLDKTRQPGAFEAVSAGTTRGKAALFATCYCNYNAPDIGRDLIAVFEHNQISVRLTEKEKCCGMPKLEQGDLDTVDKYKRQNIPMLASLVDDGWDIVAAIPSCVLMFKQELPLMYPDDEAVQKVKQHIFDPFEYLLQRHKAGLLKTDFSQSIGSVAWHVPCHQRVQNIGPKTRQVLELVPDTKIHTIERCSGHDGTYGVRIESFEKSRKIARPVITRANKTEADYLVSDCPMAATQIASGLELKHGEINPLSLLRRAYGI
jgi:Fe-S oxidoreductase